MLGDDVPLIGDLDDGPALELVAFGDVVHGVQQRDVGDPELGGVAFARVSREIHHGEIGFRPGRAFAIEHLAVGTHAEHLHGFRHFGQPCAPFWRGAIAPGGLVERIAHVLGQYRAVRGGAGPGRRQDRLADGAAIGTGQARVFLLFAAGDHQAGDDLHLAQNVSLVVLEVGLAALDRVRGVDVFGVQDFHLVGALDQLDGVRERRQADAGARGEADPVDREAKPLGKVGQQAEAVARFRDEHPWQVHGEHLADEVGQGR